MTITMLELFEFSVLIKFLRFSCEVFSTRFFFLIELFFDELMKYRILSLEKNCYISTFQTLMTVENVVIKIDR